MTKQSKPATLPPRPVPPSGGLVFSALWSDGTATRMSIYSTLKDLDLKRAAAVSHAGYSSRHHIPMDKITATITKATFAYGGEIIATYDAAAIAATSTAVVS
jgi:hypothetical protein